MLDIKGREETPVPSIPHVGTLGTLTLIKRKSGTDLQAFPLDAKRITFGRDYDCDVRLYYSDVSKLHCEILFDLSTRQATLNVLGSNGVLHTPAGGSATLHKPPANISLIDKDIITIRKKPFRFEYGTNKTTEPAIFSPAVHNSPLPAAPSHAKHIFESEGRPQRRRASHRLSLVPAGKTFVPLSPAKNRRHSTLGLGGMARTPAGQSKLSEQVQTVEGEEEGNESIVEIANGEEGDVVYLEATEEAQEEAIAAQKPIHQNPFITPQATRKAPMGNTSAVPRTRKLPMTQPIHVEEAEEAEEPVDEVEVDSAESPITPRSVPLPPVSDTPYNPPATPARKMPSTPIPASVAMSTPKGPATLRKALLLRSARKVWQESRASGIDGAIQDGAIETRRKSTSPRRKSGRKSVTPVTDVQAGENEPETADEQMDEGEFIEQPMELQGTIDDAGERSLESDSSGFDSLEADMSLDVAGQIEVNTSLLADLEEEIMNEEDQDGHPDYLDKHIQEELEEEDIIERHQDEQEEEFEAKVETTHEDMEVEEEEEDDVAMSLPGTPHVRQPISTNFFTPQPQRNIAKQPRRSLASIGGPAVRFERLPVTPGRRGTLAPAGSMGKPSRLIVPASPVQDVKVEDEPKVFATPRKSQAMLAEFKRQHEALATPRTLPVPPMSGFKDPVRETRFADLVASPMHRALAPASPEPADNEEDDDEKVDAVPATPMNDLKKRLNSIRRQSVQRQIADRRATVGFVLPQTPSTRPTVTHNASYSVASNRQLVAQAPRTPIFPSLKRETPIFPKVAQPASVQAPGQSHPPSSPEITQPSSPSTPSFTGIREMLKPSAAAAKTPYMAGIRDLYPALPTDVPSPSFAGVRDMLAAPPAVVPATPSFAGVKTLFGARVVPPTPAMEGLKEMYEEEEEEDVDQALNTSLEEKPLKTTTTMRKTSQSKLPKLSAVSTSTSTSSRVKRADPTPTLTVQVEAGPIVPAPTKTVSKIPARRGKAAAAKPAQVKETTAPAAVTVAEPKSKASRARKATVEPAEIATEETASRSTRSRRTASAEPEPAHAATTSRSRSTRTKASVEPEEPSMPAIDEKVESKNSRSRSTSSRAKKVEVKPAAVEAEEQHPAEEKSKPSRGSKRVLEMIEEQVIVAEPATKSVSAPTRGKKAAVPATIVADKEKESKSVPVRRGKAVTVAAVAVAEEGNKENHDEKEGKVVPKKRGTAAKEKESGLPVPVATRSTRSRK